MRTIPHSRRDLEARAFAAIKSAFPEVDKRVRGIEHLTQQAVDAGVEPVSLGEILHRLCEEKAFLIALMEFVQNKHDSILSFRILRCL